MYHLQWRNVHWPNALACPAFMDQKDSGCQPIIIPLLFSGHLAVRSSVALGISVLSVLPAERRSASMKKPTGPLDWTWLQPQPYLIFSHKAVLTTQRKITQLLAAWLVAFCCCNFLDYALLLLTGLFARFSFRLLWHIQPSHGENLNGPILHTQHNIISTWYSKAEAFQFFSELHHDN